MTIPVELLLYHYFLNIFLFLTLSQSTKYKLLTTANFAKAKFGIEIFNLCLFFYTFLAARF